MHQARLAAGALAVAAPGGYAALAQAPGNMSFFVTSMEDLEATGGAGLHYCFALD